MVRFENRREIDRTGTDNICQRVTKLLSMSTKNQRLAETATAKPVSLATEWHICFRGVTFSLRSTAVCPKLWPHHPAATEC